VADLGNHRIRKIDASKMVTTVAGNGTAGPLNGEGILATAANLTNPFGVASDSLGNLYYSDNANHVVRKVDKNGNVTTVAGNGRPGLTGDGGIATAALLNQPAGLAVDSSNVCISQIAATTGFAR